MKSITQQLNEFQTKAIQDIQIARNKREDNQRRFFPTIKPMLDELIRFDDNFDYEMNHEQTEVTIWYKPRNTWIDKSFIMKSDENHIITGYSINYMLVNYPDEKATEQDRFVFYITNFFSRELLRGTSL